jgi:hypothetical protein
MRVTNYFTVKKLPIRGCLITRRDDTVANNVSEFKSDIT